MDSSSSLSAELLEYFTAFSSVSWITTQARSASSWVPNVVWQKNRPNSRMPSMYAHAGRKRMKTSGYGAGCLIDSGGLSALSTDCSSAWPGHFKIRQFDCRAGKFVDRFGPSQVRLASRRNSGQRSLSIGYFDKAGNSHVHLTAESHRHIPS